MLLVVLGHACLGEPGNGPVWENLVYTFAYSFHMPLFMFISGYLFNLTRLSKKAVDGSYCWSYVDTVKEKAQRLLIPMVLFTLLAFAAKAAVPAEMSRPSEFSFGSVAKAFLYPDDSPLLEMWFIVTLFILFLLMPLWRWSVKNMWTMVFMLALLTVLHFFHPEVKLLCMERVCSYAVFFYSGVALSKWGLFGNRLSLLTELLILTASVAVYLAGIKFSPFLASAGGIMMSCCLAVIADRALPKLFCSFRDYTYQIFLMGIFFQILVKIVYRHTHVPYVLAYMVSVLAALYIPVLISKIVDAIAWKPLQVCIGLKSSSKNC